MTPPAVILWMMYLISEDVRRQRREASTVHGAGSEHQIRPVARAQKRRLMRQLGVRIGDLDGVANAMIDNWSRAHAKVVLMDQFFQARGFLFPDGEPVAAAKVYFSALNSARLALTRFGEYQKTRTPNRDMLADYIDQAYGDSEG